MRRRVSTLAALAALAGCASGGVAAPAPEPTGDEPIVSAGPSSDRSDAPLPTIGGVGDLPDSVPDDDGPSVIARPATADGVQVAIIGDQVAGNRLLMIGDSILASTTTRHGGEMCDRLVPLGWRVQIEAEAGRFVDFGIDVVEGLVPEDRGSEPVAPEGDWDAAVVHLGTNYREDPEAYEAELRVVLVRLAPRPTLLFTVTEYRPAWSEVNRIIDRLGSEYDNVTVVDWGTISRAEGVLGPDRLHPTAAGEEVLVEQTAAALGRSVLSDGECLRSEFVDDSTVAD